MSVCVPCRRRGVDREATAFDELHGPVCEDHTGISIIAHNPIEIPTPASIPARKEQPMSDPDVEPQKKRRGRPPRLPFAETSVLPKKRRRRGRPPKDDQLRDFSLAHLPSNITTGTEIDDMISKLHARRTKIDAAIAALRALHGLDK